MRLRLDEFVGEQPEQQGDAYQLSSQQQAWGRRDTCGHQLVRLRRNARSHSVLQK